MDDPLFTYLDCVGSPVRCCLLLLGIELTDTMVAASEGGLHDRTTSGDVAVVMVMSLVT
jgi:hypothetical protein